jgi:hypothetical protein
VFFKELSALLLSHLIGVTSTEQLYGFIAGSGPDPEEVLMAVQVGDTKVAFKSGYEKYVRVEAREGSVNGTSDAIGPMEQWEPVFQVNCLVTVV